MASAGTIHGSPKGKSKSPIGSAPIAAARHRVTTRGDAVMLGRRGPAALKMVPQLRWADSEGTQRSSREYDLRCLDRIIARNPLPWREPKELRKSLRQFTTVLLPRLRYPESPRVFRRLVQLSASSEI